MKASKVLNVKSQINAIPRDHDNTTDLEIAEMKAHARYTKIQAPANVNHSKDGVPHVIGTAPSG